MDTLKRVGSIRKSLRRQKKPPVPAPNTNPDAEAISPAPPEDEPILHPCYFTLTCSDAVVTSTSTAFQPTHLRVVITRHRKTYISTPVLWESSLKCHLTGAGVWHPPFVVSVSVSPPMRHKSKGTLRHKDAFVSLQNVDLKGKKKLLAKARVNLSDYYVAASVSPVAFKLKLFPESSKVSAAFVHFSVHRTDADPATLSFPVVPDDHEVEVSPVLSTARRKTSQVSSHYDEDTDEDEYTEKPSLKLSPKGISPIPGNRPSSLLLKNAITVEKPPEHKVDNNNERVPTTFPKWPAIVSSQTTKTDSAVTFNISSKVVKSEEVRLESSVLVAAAPKPDQDQSKVLAQPEDFRIDTPKKVVSGIVLPTGPPPPLPHRILNKSPLPSLRDDKLHQEPEVVQPKQQELLPPKIESPIKVVELKKIEIEDIFRETKDEAPTKNSVPESPFKVPKAVAKKKANGLKPESADSDSDDSDKHANQNISLSIGCPSPKLTPYKQASNEKELLEWSKKALASYSQIKITNLSSSWRNGLGFCALIYETYPDLVPMNSLKMQNMKENRELAFEVAKLVGVETSLLVEDLTDSSVPDKSAVMAFLKELRLVLSQSERVFVEPDVLLDFRKKWFRKCGYFAKEVEALVKAEDEATKQEEEKKEEDKYNEEQVPDPETSQPVEEERRPGRDRVREMIAAAHREASFEADDVMVSGRTLRESKTITEEMSKLAAEEVRITQEKEKLERMLRDERTTERVMEVGMQRLVQLVNEKNSLVRRQMQLNILEQEKAISHEMEEIQWRLQKFANMDDSQKTESMREEEQKLIEKHIEAVKKKNELVLYLDDQEQAIAEDERIQTLVANKDFVALKKEEECVIQ